MDRALTLRQLYYFSALAEAGHYRKAAERVGVAQPSLSQQIAALEAALGVRLVERGRAGAMLTPTGREVLARARRVLDEVSELGDLADRMAGGLSGALQLGASPTLGPYLLPNVVRRLHQQYPGLQLYIREGAPRDLERDLLDGRHDLILTQLPVLSSDLTVQRLFREPLLLAVAQDHPLADRGQARDADLAGATILSLSPAFTLHSQIAALAEEVGAKLRRDYEGTSLDALRQMAAMNMGVVFLPALYVQSEIALPRRDIAVLRFRPGRLARSIGVAWRRTAGTPTGFTAFADVVREVASNDFAGLVQLER